MTRPGRRAGFATLVALAFSGASFAQTTLVEFGDAMTYRANDADPGIALDWVDPAYDDSGWATGEYGVGYDTNHNADSLFRVVVPDFTRSVYTRARFAVADLAAVQNIHIGVDYDDGYVAWLNGVEIHRSASMPAGVPVWDAAPASHGSSDGPLPDYEPLYDVTAAALPAMVVGENVLAIGVYNRNSTSSDLVLVPQLSINHPFRLPRGPYLQKGTPTSMVVRWRTAADADSSVRYGTDPTSLTMRVDDPATTTEHEIELTGLTPDTLYHYAIGSIADVLVGGDDNHYFRTGPTPPTPKPMRIWILGDSGQWDDSAREVRGAYDFVGDGIETDLWLMLGDNAYPDGTDDEYQLAVFDMYPRYLRTAPLWPTLGNHDARSADSGNESGVYYDIFSLPGGGEAGGIPSGTEAYYSFDYANVHLLSLDSEDSSLGDNDAQMQWLRADMDDTMQDWAIAFWHHPPYSKGSHDSDDSGTMTAMRDVANRILEDRGVDLVFTGHSHAYERTWLIDGHYGDSMSFDPSHQVDAGDGKPAGDGAYLKPLGITPRNGAVYTVAGSSSKTSGVDADWPHDAMFEWLEDVLGSVILDINRNRLDAIFLDDAGAVRDSYTIIKGGSAPPARPGRLDASATCAVELTWGDPGTDEDGFAIERSEDGVTWLPLITVGVDVTTHSDVTASPLTAYWYRVRAYNATAPSAWSNVLSLFTTAGAAPGVVGNSLRMVGVGGTDIHATWDDIPAATGYNLYEAADKADPFVTPTGSGSDGVTGITFPTPPANRMLYRLAAENVCGEGSL